MTTSTRRFLGLYSGRRRRITLFVVASLLQAVASVPMPFIIRRIFDSALAEGRIGELIGLIAVILGLQLLSSLLGVIATSLILDVNSRVVQRLRESLFEKLQALPIRFHETRPIGDNQDRVVRETERVFLLASNGYATIVPASIFVIGILAALTVVNWQLLLVTVAFVPVVWWVNHATRLVLRSSARAARSSTEEFSSSTLRMLSAIRQTRILGAEQRALADQIPVLEAKAHSERRIGSVRRIHTETNIVVLTAWMLIVLAFGGAGVVDGRLTLGDLLAFYAGLVLIRVPLTQVTNALPVIIDGRQALERVFDLLDDDEPNPYSGTHALDVDGHLVLTGVSFGYDLDAPVLTSASLEVNPREVIALTGPNGSGKTTVVNLILGFYRPDEGRLEIDGVDYDDLDMGHLRRQFGVVTQHPILVPGSVRKNITYGRPDISDDDVLAVLEVLSAPSLADDLAHGLDTKAFENGPLLSGGQVQRIALARALIGQPRLLILDEPSNHLDADALQALLDTLRNLPAGPAIIVITHELQVADLADIVYELADGTLTPRTMRDDGAISAADP